jgi:DNA-directed RNA polymerase specialized sigma24 family protein
MEQKKFSIIHLDVFARFSFDYFEAIRRAPRTNNSQFLMRALDGRSNLTRIFRRDQSIFNSLRQVVSFRCYSGATTKEVAIMLGLTESAVKTRLNRARSRLRLSVLKGRAQRRSIA